MENLKSTFIYSFLYKLTSKSAAEPVSCSEYSLMRLNKTGESMLEPQFRSPSFWIWAQVTMRETQVTMAFNTKSWSKDLNDDWATPMTWETNISRTLVRMYSRRDHKWGIGIGSSPIGCEGFLAQKGQGLSNKDQIIALQSFCG